MKKKRVLFVCLGNICRSPMAEGVFRNLVQEKNAAHEFEIDSAGTGAWHVGEGPDSRATSAARGRNVDISEQQARKVAATDFSSFDIILAMDNENYETLLARAPDNQHHKIRLFMDFATQYGEREVPDPYFGGTDGFQHVLNLVEDAAQGLFDHLQTSTSNS